MTTSKNVVPPTKTSVSAVLLAAGESTRMGTLKATLDWQGKPLIIYQLEQLLATDVNQITVVLGFKADELTTLIKDWSAKRSTLVDPVILRQAQDERGVGYNIKRGIRIVVNKRYAQGRTTSIVTGVSAVPKTDAVMVFSVDQPRPAAVLQRLIEAHTKGRITTPAFGDKHGHPPIYDASFHDELLRITEATVGLKSVNKRHEKDIRYIPFDSDAVLVNLNRPEDYEKAHAKYGKKPGV